MTRNFWEKQAMHETTPSGPGHETRDISFRAVYRLTGLIIVSAVVIHLGVWWLFRDLQGRQKRGMPEANPLAKENRGRLPPPPQLEGLQRMNRPFEERPPETSRPDSYGWVDRKAEIVRVPVDRAMNLIVEQKLIPSSGSQSQSQNPYAGLPSPANSGRGAPKEKP
jgi:hypothetical protein